MNNIVHALRWKIHTISTNLILKTAVLRYSWLISQTRRCAVSGVPWSCEDSSWSLWSWNILKFNTTSTANKIQDKRPKAFIYQKDINNVSNLLMFSSSQAWMSCCIKWNLSVDGRHFPRKRGLQSWNSNGNKWLSHNGGLKLASIRNTIILFVCPSKILHKHCFQFLLGPL